ncbi:hypothetical protein HQN90_19510 [Paenibacillus alba]|nr:hypothetical protein [Paenibacillus alba]
MTTIHFSIYNMVYAKLQCAYDDIYHLGYSKLTSSIDVNDVSERYWQSVGVNVARIRITDFVGGLGLEAALVTVTLTRKD